jgi:hypothetical protein
MINQLRKGDEHMDKKKKAYLFVAGLVLLGLLSGCGVSQNYGKNILASRGTNQMTIETLIENWQDYAIYYSGISAQQPYAVVFDPKNDGRTLDVTGWTPIGSEEALKTTLGQMKTFMRGSQRLFKVLGPDDQLYGYLYTPVGEAKSKVTGPNTLRLYTIGVGGG